jgi:hypothetical protein
MLYWPADIFPADVFIKEVSGDGRGQEKCKS